MLNHYAISVECVAVVYAYLSGHVRGGCSDSTYHRLSRCHLQWTFVLVELFDEMDLGVGRRVDFSEVHAAVNLS